MLNLWIKQSGHQTPFSRLNKRQVVLIQTLDAGNTSRSGGLLSGLFSLVGLKHSNSLIHLQHKWRWSWIFYMKHSWQTDRYEKVAECFLIKRHWPWSAGTLETPACGAAQSCRSPEAYRWSCLPGWGACSESGGTGAHLHRKMTKH